MNLDEEIRDGFIVDKARKKLWAIELELLENFKQICERYGLDWFLIGGSAIGAVRHKGFIPWDDDIDIGMKREDFEKLMKVDQIEWKDSVAVQYGLTDGGKQFHFFCRIRDKNSTGIIKEEVGNGGVQGIFIEIYPFDFVPDSAAQRKYQWKKSMLLIELIRQRVYGAEVGKKAALLSPFAKIFSVQKLYQMWYKTCTKYNDRQRKLMDTVSIPGYSESEVDLYFTKDIEKTVEVPYEDTTARIPVGNDRCLRKTYGDYMKLPPVEQRAQHHDAVVFYDPFVPYTQYENDKKVEAFFQKNKF